MFRVLPQELGWLFPKVKAQLSLHLASFVCFTLAGVLAIVGPLSIRWLIDSVLPERNPRILVLAVALIFASLEGKAALAALGGYLTFRATQGTALELRWQLLRHLDSLSAEHFDRTPVGQLLYPLEAPVDEIAYFGSDLLPSVLRTVIAAGATLAAMVGLSPALTLAALPVVPAFLILRWRYRSRIGHQADRIQAAKAKLSSFLQEHLAALTEIQLLRQTEKQESRGLQLLTAAARRQNALCGTAATFSALSNLAVATGLAAALAWGSARVFCGRLTVGTLVAFYSLLIQLFDPLGALMELYARAQRTFASVRQIQSILDVTPAVREAARARTLSADVPLHIVLCGVSFRYPGNRQGIHIPRLEILQGEHVVVAGPNGAGKSTLAKLLVRLYDVDSGRILLGGGDLRTLSLASLRSSVCYLPARPALFHGTLARNLRAGRSPCAEDDLQEVLQLVGLAGFLGSGCTLAEVPLDPGAANLSNGERQRVAIARALLQRPRILILDETTSSLDPESEEAILRRIARRLPDTTLLVLSHRLHSLSWIGRRLLMERGRIIEDRRTCGPVASHSSSR
jgi:ATP-binding cassette subfamily B protein